MFAPALRNVAYARKTFVSDGFNMYPYFRR